MLASPDRRPRTYDEASALEPGPEVPRRAFEADDVADEAAVEWQREGNAFSASFQVHRAYLHQWALRLTNDEADANELVQDTFVRALFHPGLFAKGINVRAWLSKILANLYFDYLKHEKVVDFEPAVAAPAPASADLGIAAVSEATIRQAIETLDVELREVVELCYLQNLGYHEAGLRLKLPVSTIGTRLMRARKYLSRMLAGVVES